MNSAKRAQVIGAGGHAKVVATLRENGYTLRAASDDPAQKWGKVLLVVPIVGPPTQLENPPARRAAIAIGGNNLTGVIAERC